MKFVNVIGQQEVKDKLLKSVADDRISHAQLFLATEGAGALAMALAYSQYINCTNRTATDSCGTCSSCVKCAKLIHPDVHFFYPVSNSKKIKSEAKSIDYIESWRSMVTSHPYFTFEDWTMEMDIENRQPIIAERESSEIIKRLSLKSYEAEYKTCIIWLAEKMNDTTSNKLLKILEEPPDKTLFILITENYDQILPTIISRTQLIKINRIAETDLVQYIIAKKPMPQGDAIRIVHICENNLKKIDNALLDDKVDFAFEKKFLEWMRICLKPIDKAKEMIAFNATVAELGREQIKLFLAFCIETSRECLLHNYGHQSMHRFTDEVFAGFTKFAPFIHQKNIQPFVKELSDASYHIERNANPKILFMDLTFKLARLLNIK